MNQTMLGVLHLLERIRLGDECRLGPNYPVEPLEMPQVEEPISEPRTILRVGAWTGASTLANPAKSVTAAASARLDEIHLMVADHSAWKERTPFLEKPEKGRRAASMASLVAVGKACALRGIKLGLTTWVMPFDEYVDGCADYLREAVDVLQGVSPVRTIILDAEEPWTKARGASARWSRGAQRLGKQLESLQSASVRIGLTGIGYARESALDPLAEWCDFSVPQVYATAGNSLDPRKAPKQFSDRWTKKFERKKISIGLASYGQRPGAMAEAIAGARAVAADKTSAECDEVIYWSLRSIQLSAAKTRLVAGIKGVA